MDYFCTMTSRKNINNHFKTIKSREMKDHETISNEWHELSDAAAELGVKTWQVQKAKDDLGTNKRSEVYKHIKKQLESPVESKSGLISSSKKIEAAKEFGAFKERNTNKVFVFNGNDWEEYLTQMRNKLNVIQWAEAKNLVKYENRFVQFAKVVEEVGELGKGLIKGDKELEKDSIGDAVVTLIILSAQLGLDIEDCLEHAYQEIKDRTGTTNENGTFIKD